MQDWKFFVVPAALLLAIPLVIGFAYLMWEINHFAAAMVIFVGIFSILLEGCWLVDYAVSHS